ncbi:unnamed protein product [Fusarium graminearum]|nr:unnamed protein product [Fusarium graminearum]
MSRRSLISRKKLATQVSRLLSFIDSEQIDLPNHPCIICVREFRSFQTCYQACYPSKLLAQEPGACTYDCRSMMLGTLIQGMNAARIWPPPLPPFPSPSISTVIFSLRGIHLHTYFGPESGAYASIFSGKWHRATSSLPIQRQDNASAAPEHPQRKFAVATGTAGRIYSGTSMTPQNPTSTQGSRSPWPNVGGNTGTVTPFWGHNGLTPSAAATESQEGPPTLVQHHCCLMDCLKPMLDAVEGKIEGLKLEEFTRP